MSNSVTRKREENTATYQRPYHPSHQHVSSLFFQNTVIPSFQTPLHLSKNASGESDILVESGHDDNSGMKSVVVVEVFF
jgi:hypothetical protein